MKKKKEDDDDDDNDDAAQFKLNFVAIKKANILFKNKERIR